MKNIYLNVSNPFEKKYESVTRIVAKRFKSYYSNSIMLLDVETETTFTFTLQQNFSKKNVVDFLKTKFESVEITNPA